VNILGNRTYYISPGIAWKSTYDKSARAEGSTLKKISLGH